VRAVRSNRGQVEVLDLPLADGEGVSVRIRSAGICGSDLHLLDLGMPLPFTLGHEMAGELADGTPVAIEPLTSCGHCDCCEDDDYNLCREGTAAIMGVGRDGGMADEIRVPARCLVPLSAGISVADGCLVEPLAVAVHGMRRARVSPGRSVAVIGGGTIGLCAVAAAGAGGARVSLEARHDAQRMAGERLGAGPTQGEYDLVVDSAGTTSALERAIELCRPGGRLLLLGTYWQGMNMPGMALCMKEIRVIPSNMYSREGMVRDFDVAATILAARPEIAAAIITHRYSLDEAPAAFAMARDRSAGAIKVVLEP
jgi:2-desacetyl-2-hydroxyethyl bacteriochlorophyllide A dehydrogenase